jgi:hypothetical protein
MNTIDITKHHKNKVFANQSLEWLDLDSKSLWYQNMQDPERRQQLTKYGFAHSDSIVYKLNSHGFRSEEFDDRAGFIALGCSFTCGIGLPIDQVWPSIVAQRTGLIPWNLGIGAAGLDTCFRMLYNYIDQLKPKFVMLLMPDPNRFEIHNLGMPSMVMHNSTHPNSAIESLKKFYFSDEQNSAVNLAKNMLAINQICQSRHIKLMAKPLYPTLLGTRVSSDKWPAARDLQHVGYLEQQRCAEIFLTELDQN